MSNTKTVYLDGIDWQHHIPDDSKGVKVFGSIEDAVDGNACLKRGGGCGVVKVEMRLIEWVVPQDLEGEMANKESSACEHAVENLADILKEEDNAG